MSRRTAKVSEAIREIVSTTILFGLKDPRVKNVTVLWADAAPDLRSARIFLSVRGEPKEQTLTLHGLNSARGYIQSQIADKLDLRYTPILQFVLDPGAKQAAEISSLLRSAMEQTNRDQVALATGGDSADEESSGVKITQAAITGEIVSGGVSSGVFGTEEESLGDNLVEDGDSQEAGGGLDDSAPLTAARLQDSPGVGFDCGDDPNRPVVEAVSGDRMGAEGRLGEPPDSSP